MRYLLDSSALIWYVRGNPTAVRVIQQLAENGEDLGVCAICVAEFYSGATPGTHPKTDAFIRALDYFSIGHDDAVQAGVYRREFARRGIQLSTQDTLIAAVARRVGATLITENLKDFPMDDVRTASLSSL